MFIIINGPCGVGKSSVSKYLSKKLKDCIYIKGDDVRSMIVDSQIVLKQIMLADKNILSLVENFARAGYKNIIIDNVYEQHTHLLRVVEELQKFNSELYVFRLTCDLCENIKRDGQRIPNDVCGKERVIELYNIYRNVGNCMGYVVDVTSISPEEAANEINEYLSMPNMVYQILHE